MPDAATVTRDQAGRAGYAGYAHTISGAGGGAGYGRGPVTGGRGRRRDSRNRRMAIIGGTAAVILAAAGVLYVASKPSGSQGAVSASSATTTRPSKPTLTATLTVPGGGTIDTTWVSPDGKLIAASGQGSTIYVWNTATPAKVTTFSAPGITLGKTMYPAVIDNLAFSADDSSLTAVVYPNVPSGAPTPGSESAYDVYQWNLATGKRTVIWSVGTPSTVAFSNDNSTALTYQNNVVSQVTLSPALYVAPAVTLPDGADQSYPPPYELDLNGGRMIYHPTSAETYVWDFSQESVIAKLRSSEYTVLSPDGKTILVANPSNYPTAAGGSGSAVPTLWDVATQSNITPSDPRWKEQLRQPWQTYSWNTYSTDGSVIVTQRAGGKLDLWSTATRKYLLTVTVPVNHKDGYALVGPGGSEVLILTSEKTLNGENEYRQISLWETPLKP